LLFLKNPEAKDVADMKESIVTNWHYFLYRRVFVFSGTFTGKLNSQVHV
jgi:hypothetical protein